MYLYFTFECSNYLDLSSTRMALKRTQAKYARAAFTYKWKYEKLAVVVRVPQTTQNLVISRYGYKMHKDLKRTCTAIVVLKKSLAW